MKMLILVKLGGSLITDKNKPFTPRIGTIKRLAKEIHESREGKKFLVYRKLFTHYRFLKELNMSRQLL